MTKTDPALVDIMASQTKEEEKEYKDYHGIRRIKRTPYGADNGNFLIGISSFIAGAGRAHTRRKKVRTFIDGLPDVVRVNKDSEGEILSLEIEGKKDGKMVAFRITRKCASLEIL